MSSPHVFSHFRQHFIAESAWAKERGAAEQPQQAAAAGSKEGRRDPVVKMASLGPPRGGLVRPLMLDLNFLPRENGPPSSNPDYEELRRQKFAKFEMQCSKVAEGLYVSGAAVAQDRAILAQHSISHVVNCVGALYQEYFRDDGVAYKTLWLQDIPHEDITCILYDTFDFIENARQGTNSISIMAAAAAAGSGGSGSSGTQRQSSLCMAAGNQLQPQQPQQPPGCTPGNLPSQQQHQHQYQRGSSARAADGSAAAVVSEPGAAAAAGGSSSSGGRVLVHCSQGVSRSTTIAIAYLMWKTGGSYDEVYQAVRALRGVTSPNVGFMCQLINWAKRRQRPPSRTRVYRIAPHCPEDATYLVPKAVSPKPGSSHADWTALDCRGCFVVHLPQSLYVWRGSNCLGVMADAGWRAAGALVRYEGASPPELVRQGEEPDDLLAALNPNSSSCSGSGQPDSSALPSMELSYASLPAVPATADALAASATAAAVGAAAGAGLDDGGMRLAAGGSRPCSAQQQQQQQPGPASAGQQRHPQQQRQVPPWLTGGASSSSSSGHPSSRSRAGGAALQQQQQQQGEAELLSAQLSSNVQLAGGLLGMVGEVDEYSADYELWLRALLKSGAGCSMETGRLTPRGSLVGLAVDDIATGSSSSGGLGGRCESPATTEGRNRKYRRSETDSTRCVVPSFRQPGRLSASSNPSLWPGAATAAAAAAAAGALPAAAVGPSNEAAAAGEQQRAPSNSADAAGRGTAGVSRACSETGQIGDMKRMSIDEGDERMS